MWQSMALKPERSASPRLLPAEGQAATHGHAQGLRKTSHSPWTASKPRKKGRALLDDTSEELTAGGEQDENTPPGPPSSDMQMLAEHLRGLRVFRKASGVKGCGGRQGAPNAALAAPTACSAFFPASLNTALQQHDLPIAGGSHLDVHAPEPLVRSSCPEANAMHHDTFGPLGAAGAPAVSGKQHHYPQWAPLTTTQASGFTAQAVPPRQRDAGSISAAGPPAASGPALAYSWELPRCTPNLGPLPALHTLSSECVLVAGPPGNMAALDAPERAAAADVDVTRASLMSLVEPSFSRQGPGNWHAAQRRSPSGPTGAAGQLGSSRAASNDWSRGAGSQADGATMVHPRPGQAPGQAQQRHGQDMGDEDFRIDTRPLWAASPVQQASAGRGRSSGGGGGTVTFALPARDECVLRPFTHKPGGGMGAAGQTPRRILLHGAGTPATTIKVGAQDHTILGSGGRPSAGSGLVNAARGHVGFLHTGFLPSGPMSPHPSRLPRRAGTPAGGLLGRFLPDDGSDDEDVMMGTGSLAAGGGTPAVPGGADDARTVRLQQAPAKPTGSGLLKKVAMVLGRFSGSGTPATPSWDGTAAAGLGPFHLSPGAGATWGAGGSRPITPGVRSRAPPSQPPLSAAELRRRQELEEEAMANLMCDECDFCTPPHSPYGPALPSWTHGSARNCELRRTHSADEATMGRDAAMNISNPGLPATAGANGWDSTLGACSWDVGMQITHGHGATAAATAAIGPWPAGCADGSGVDARMATPGTLDTLQDFNLQLSQAAERGDRTRAERLWFELCSRCILPDMRTLNTLMRCLCKSVVHPDEAEELMCEVCTAGGLRPNATTFTLLAEIRLRSEQLHAH